MIKVNKEKMSMLQGIGFKHFITPFANVWTIDFDFVNIVVQNESREIRFNFYYNKPDEEKLTEFINFVSISELFERSIPKNTSKEFDETFNEILKYIFIGEKENE